MAPVMLPVLVPSSSVRVSAAPPGPLTVPEAWIRASSHRYPMPSVGPISTRSLRTIAKR